MGFIGTDDKDDPTNYDFVTSSTSSTGNVDFTGSTVTSTFTVPSLFYCGHCPRRFKEEHDYEFHIIWHMMDDLIREWRDTVKPKPWWGKLEDIEDVCLCKGETINPKCYRHAHLAT